MSLSRHPYYGEFSSAGWISVDEASSLECGARLRETQQQFSELALARVKKHAGDEYLRERPYAEPHEILVLPTQGQGFRIYFEFFFFQRLDESSPDSDFWWAIVNCPSSPGQPIAGHVTDLGWAVA